MNIYQSHRNGYLALALGALLTLGLAACSSDDLLPAAPDGGSNPDAQPLITITANIGGGAGASTRTVHEDLGAGNGVKVSWAKGDQFIIFSLDAEGELINGSTFTLVDGDAGKESASFVGDKPAEGESYVICYPANVTFDSSSKSFYLDMSGQKQTGNSSTAHLGKFAPMQGHLVNEGNDFSEISFNDDNSHLNSGHRATMMRFDLTGISDKLGTPLRLELESKAHFTSSSVVTGSMAQELVSTFALVLENVAVDNASITAYMMMAPFSIPAGENLTVTLVGNEESYTFTSPKFTINKDYKRGMRYTASAGSWNESAITFDGNAGISHRYIDGDGTKEDPYLICTASDLKKMIEATNAGNVSSKYFKLTQDVNIAMAEGKEWIPIGNANKPFNGHFDGHGHTISGEMKGSATVFGFFGYTENATITKLHVTANVTAMGTNPLSTGAIAGYPSSSIISYCTNAGTVLGGNEVGGIVGINDNCTLINCTNTGDVTSRISSIDRAGGVVSSCNVTTIVGCTNSGHISGYNVGGIAGRHSSGASKYTSTIRDCLNTGLITLTGSTIGVSGAIIGGNTLGILDLSYCYYLYAPGQSGNLVVCGGRDDSSFINVGKCDDFSALNGCVSALNVDIANWNASVVEKNLPICYRFKAGNGTTAPVINFSSASSGI